jgi:hypothetical protein
MKRFVLLLICTTVCLCLLATPAFAKKRVTQQTYRPPVDAQFMWGPWWWEYSGVTGTIADVSWHQADPSDTFEYAAVSKSDPILLFAISLGVGYGEVNHVPNILNLAVDVRAPDGVVTSISPEEVRAHWKGPYVWDQFWIDWWDSWFMDGWVPEPFNPNMGTVIYGMMLELPLDDIITTTGTYHVDCSWVNALPRNDKFYFGDPSRPVRTPPGGWVVNEDFNMEVVN